MLTRPTGPALYILHLLQVIQAQKSTEAWMAWILRNLVENTNCMFEALEEMVTRAKSSRRSAT